MKSQDILLIMLILILFFPSSPLIPQKDIYTLYANEGMIATQVFSQNGTDLKPQPDLVPTPNPQFKCEKCKDKGYIISGDGQFRFPCPDCKVPKTPDKKCECGCNKIDCNCNKIKESIEKTLLIKETEEEINRVLSKIEKNNIKQDKETKINVLLFTQPSNCPPCHQYEVLVKPELLKRGIKISKDKDSVIREINPTLGTQEESDLWNQYRGLGNGGIPMFVFIKDNKVIEIRNGFIDLNTTLKLLGK